MLLASPEKDVMAALNEKPLLIEEIDRSANAFMASLKNPPITNPLKNGLFSLTVKSMSSKMADFLVMTSGVFGYSQNENVRPNWMPLNVSLLLADIHRYPALFYSTNFFNLVITQKTPGETIEEKFGFAYLTPKNQGLKLKDLFNKISAQEAIGATTSDPANKIALNMLAKYEANKEKSIATILLENNSDVLSMIGVLAVVKIAKKNGLTNLNYSQTIGRHIGQALNAHFANIVYDFGVSTNGNPFKVSYLPNIVDSSISYTLQDGSSLIASRIKTRINVDAAIENSLGLNAGDLNLDFYAIEAIESGKSPTFKDLIKLESDVKEITALVNDLHNIPPGQPFNCPEIFKNEIFLRILHANIAKYDHEITEAESRGEDTADLIVKRQLILNKYNDLCDENGYSDYKISSSGILEFITKSPLLTALIIIAGVALIIGIAIGILLATGGLAAIPFLAGIVGGVAGLAGVSLVGASAATISGVSAVCALGFFAVVSGLGLLAFNLYKAIGGNATPIETKPADQNSKKKKSVGPEKESALLSDYSPVISPTTATAAALTSTTSTATSTSKTAAASATPTASSSPT